MSNQTTMRTPITSCLLMFALLWQGQSCRKGGADNVSSSGMQSVMTGTWGGDHVQMDVAKDGAKLEFDCAHGAIDEPLVVSRDGRFDLKGVFVRERGGPVRQGHEEKRLPARYAGRVDRKTMTLSIKLTETGQDIGTFTLTQGSAARLTKCL
jgi:hypothetical protein